MQIPYWTLLTHKKSFKRGFTDNRAKSGMEKLSKI